VTADAIVGAPTAPRVAIPVSRFDAQEVLDENLRLVCSALDADVVPYVVLDAATMRRRLVVVPATCASDAVTALSRWHGAEPVYVVAVTERGNANLSDSVLAADAPSARSVARAQVLRVYRLLTAGETRLAGPGLGCELQFWSVVTDSETPSTDGGYHPPGTLLAPRPNRWTSYLTPDQFRAERSTVGTSRVSFCAATRKPHLLDVRFPVDVVYTWVDGSDPAWRARRDSFLRAVPSGVDSEAAASAARFQCRDELRYSLRSLQMYAGWVRQIFLVTDKQVPEWLDLSDRRVHVIDHSEIFPDATCLPTFNSHAIESVLHRIPGLAEHFLYFNDDVFLGRPIGPELFFWSNGLPKFFPSRATLDLDGPRDRDVAVLTAAKNNRRLVAAASGAWMSNKLKHTPMPLTRTLMFEMEERFTADFERTRASRFRHPDDISSSSSLAQWYGFATGRAVPGTISYRYINIAAADAGRQYAMLLAQRDSDVFCLNDTDTGELDESRRDQLVTEFMSSYFPVPSLHERAAIDEAVTSRHSRPGGEITPRQSAADSSDVDLRRYGTVRPL
jgi:hypothetical protein